MREGVNQSHSLARLNIFLNNIPFCAEKKIWQGKWKISSPSDTWSKIDEKSVTCYLNGPLTKDTTWSSIETVCKPVFLRMMRGNRLPLFCIPPSSITLEERLVTFSSQQAKYSGQPKCFFRQFEHISDFTLKNDLLYFSTWNIEKRSFHMPFIRSFNKWNIPYYISEIVILIIVHYLLLSISLLQKHSTGGLRYMWTFYLQFRVYSIKIMAFQRNVSSNLQMLLVSLYAKSLYACQFFMSLPIAYNEGCLYIALNIVRINNKRQKYINLDIFKE